MTTETPTASRRLGLGLLIGIIVLPVLFAWLTLRAGHSGGQRLAAFAWMGVSLLIGIANVTGSSV